MKISFLLIVALWFGCIGTLPAQTPAKPAEEKKEVKETAPALTELEAKDFEINELRSNNAEQGISIAFANLASARNGMIDFKASVIKKHKWPEDTFIGRDAQGTIIVTLPKKEEPKKNETK